MKMRLAARLLLVSAAVAVATAVASPAQAQLPGYVKYASYGWPEACTSAGYYYQHQGVFRYYYCETVQPANPASGPGLYNLWVSY